MIVNETNLVGKGQISPQWKLKNYPPNHEKLVARQKWKNSQHPSNPEKLVAKKFLGKVRLGSVRLS
jgi:hypothetical protein